MSATGAHRPNQLRLVLTQPAAPRFDGPEYVKRHDHKRLSLQHEKIKTLMLDGVWRTLDEIAELTNEPHASISAQLRHLRKERFGSYVVGKRIRGARARGHYEYCVLPPPSPKEGA
jgi:hypothetical protein